MDTKALRLGIACVALLGLAACGNNSRPMIMVTDSGGTDAGSVGTDSGMGGMDAGGGATCGSIATATGWPPLPASCTPRCSSATLTTAAGCGTDQMCQQNAFDADTTPPANVDTGAEPFAVDCAGCINWQGNSCVYDACPTEFNAYLMCAAMAMNPDTECMTQTTALNGCITTNMTAVQTCYQGTMTAPGRVYDCFPGGGGIAPGSASGAASSAAALQLRLHFDLGLAMSIAR